VSTHTEVSTKIAGQCSDVRASRTLHAHVYIDVLCGSVHRKHVECRDAHRSLREFDIFACTDPVIGALAIDLDRAHRTRALLDRAHETTDRPDDQLLADY